MAKFKVGDKVVSTSWQKGVTGVIVRQDKIDGLFVVAADSEANVTTPSFKENEKRCFFHFDSELQLIEQPIREFIVIHRSGNVMTAEHRMNREVIKSAKATCAPSDTFDFRTGAKLAFDRLMGREEPKPAPAPEPPKFYTGKVFAVNPKPQWVDDPDIYVRNNRVYEFKDGCIIGDRCGLVELNQPYRSFAEFAEDKYSTEWREVKE